MTSYTILYYKSVGLHRLAQPAVAWVWFYTMTDELICFHGNYCHAPIFKLLDDENSYRLFSLLFPQWDCLKHRRVTIFRALIHSKSDIFSHISQF